MKQKIENFIYAHSSLNGCVALTRTERDKLFEMLDEFQEQVKLIESVTDANADLLEEEKSKINEINYYISNIDFTQIQYCVDKIKELTK